MKVSGYIVDICTNQIISGTITVSDGRIVSIFPHDDVPNIFILPGLIDAHVHIESSLLIPSRFSELVVPRGTVATVSDPHEIANVCGIEGVRYLMEDAKTTPLKVYFGAPSCVPATSFETSGYAIGPVEIQQLIDEGVRFLGEMMNFPGVISQDKQVINLLEIARENGLPIDGHAPGISGKELEVYVRSGISTDHECSSIQEAEEKIKLGMMVQIREGSAARNFDALHPLIRKYSQQVMLCTDDSHPDLLASEGHIDRLIRRGLVLGYSIFEMYQVCVFNPIKHYGLSVGMLQKGDPADFIIVDNLTDFNVKETYINGTKVASEGEIRYPIKSISTINNFKCEPIEASQLKIKAPFNAPNIQVIDALEGELLTGKYKWQSAFFKEEEIIPDLDNDILKIVVVNRYKKVDPVIGFIRNFGLKKGAICSSIAHDSHNLIAIGCDDESLVNAINCVIDHRGGICVADKQGTDILPLPIAGLMSDDHGKLVSDAYMRLNKRAKQNGATMKAPFMTLSFMSLLVIPCLKIGDKGLFDVDTFSFTNLFSQSKNE